MTLFTSGSLLSLLLFVPAHAIYNGSVVRENNPLLLSTVRLRTRQGTGICTGVLIAENKVLTASHCMFMMEKPGLSNEEMQASVSLMTGNGGVTETVNSSDVAFPHGDQEKQVLAQLQATVIEAGKIPYQNKTYAGFERDMMDLKPYENASDLAIVTLSAPFTAPHKIIKIWTKPLQVGDEVKMAGFGMSQFGVASSGKLRTGIFKVMTVQNNMLRMTSESRMMDGDSGGPSFIEKNGELFVVGVNLGTQSIFTEEQWHKQDWNKETSLSYALMMNLSKFTKFLASAGK